MATRARTDPATEAWTLLIKLMWSQRGRLAAWAGEEGLSPMQVHALRHLDPERPVAMSELAESLVCDASNVTGIVDRLESHGLVERRSTPEDRRVKRLFLTEAGELTRGRLLGRMHAPPPELRALTPAEQRQLRDLLRRALGPA